MLIRLVFLLAGLLSASVTAETLAEIGARVGKDTSEAFAASPFMEMSRDYTSRISRDPGVKPAADEMAIDETWRLVLADNAPPLAAKMAAELSDFLARRMGLALKVETLPAASISVPPAKTITLSATGGGKADTPESYTIVVNPERVLLAAIDAPGLRDAVVRLIDRIGLRAGPVLTLGEETRAPLLPVRLGPVPSGGSYRETVMLGYNAVLCGGGSLFALSRSNAIPELAARRVEGMPEQNAVACEAARAFGLKTYAFLDMRQKFPKDDPIFTAHPDLRGALTWKADGEYVLCTEHPLMQQWLEESITGLFKADPQTNGIVLIIGGEGFYHCYMRPFDVKKGHTNCKRCEPLGAEQAVANLCNRLARAARSVNPDAEVIIWPYSAEHVWSADKTQEQLIAKLEPGVALLTEIEKDEYVEKPDGVRKHLWDYSIDLIGPGERAKKQIAACNARGLNCYLKSEPESAFEAPRLPHIPCIDRWWDRAEALATCGAKGAWVFPAFRGCYATTASEVNKFAWWTPNAGKENSLLMLARRIAGHGGMNQLRDAWREVSEAIPLVPEIPPYYTGPYYLGPAQPMICDPNAMVPEVFNGYYLFMAEISDDEGVKKRPTYYTKPSGNAPVFTRYYRRMEGHLRAAAAQMDAARPHVPERCRTVFDAEDSSVQWFYRTARTEANFYDSCLHRDRVLKLVAQEARTPEESAEGLRLLDEWEAIVRDDLENTRASLPLIAADARLDAYFGGDHTFSHTADMLNAKLGLLDVELKEFLPELRAKLK